MLIVSIALLVAASSVAVGVGVADADVAVSLETCVDCGFNNLPPLDAAVSISSEIMLLFTSQLFGEIGGEVDDGEADAELELATELQLPVLRDKSVGSFSLADAEA